MHAEIPPAAAQELHSPPPPGWKWYRELNSGHWFILVVAALGWLFDTMDQQLFALARTPALRELLPRVGDATAVSPTDLTAANGQVTAVFLIGWATGGLIFGVLGDRFGRARIMAWTILLYSLFTGLSAFSVGLWDFALYRFLTGLGVGGEFAVGVALVAEAMPTRARPYALGLVQALSTVGNIAAAFVGMGLGHLEHSGAIGSAWRWMFVVGAVPALLVLVIRSRLKEPESWVRAREERRRSPNPASLPQLGSYREMFSVPLLRHRAIIGLLMAFSGVVGLWGIGFYVFDLFDAVLRQHFKGANLTGPELDGTVAWWKGICSIMFNFGGFFGIYAFAPLSQRIGRLPTFALSYTAAGLTTAGVFLTLDQFHEIYWMVPVMGFSLMSLFGGFAVYFPELFPTRLRSTGTSFCYNVGRFVAASGPWTLGLLTHRVYASYGAIDATLPLRYAGATMCVIFLMGLAALPFAPETKDQPLPE